VSLKLQLVYCIGARVLWTSCSATVAEQHAGISFELREREHAVELFSAKKAFA